MDEGQKSPRDKVDVILEKLEHIDKRFTEVQAYEKYLGETLQYISKERLEYIDDRVYKVQRWVTFIGIVVLLGIIVPFLSPVCGS